MLPGTWGRSAFIRHILGLKLFHELPEYSLIKSLCFKAFFFYRTCLTDQNRVHTLTSAVQRADAFYLTVPKYKDE